MKTVCRNRSCKAGLEPANFLYWLRFFFAASRLCENIFFHEEVGSRKAAKSQRRKGTPHRSADHVCSENLIFGIFDCSDRAPPSDIFDSPIKNTSKDGSFSIELNPASETAVRKTLSFLSFAKRSTLARPESVIFVPPIRSVSRSVSPLKFARPLSDKLVRNRFRNFNFRKPARCETPSSPIGVILRSNHSSSVNLSSNFRSTSLIFALLRSTLITSRFELNSTLPPSFSICAAALCSSISTEPAIRFALSSSQPFNSVCGYHFPFNITPARSSVAEMFSRGFALSK